MSLVAFDTLKFVQKLEAAGIQRPHAIATAEAVAEGFVMAELADKADIVTVRTEMAANKTELKTDIAAVRAEAAANKTELKNDIAAVKSDLAAVKVELKAEAAANKAELKTDIAALDQRMTAGFRDVEQRMTIKLGGMLIVVTSVLLAAIRYLGH